MRTDSLHFKINAAILITTIVIAIIFGVILYPVEIRRHNSHVKNIHLLLDNIFQQENEDLANELFAGQKRALALSLREILKFEGIVAASVHMPDGELFLSTDERLSDRMTEIERETIGQSSAFVKKSYQDRSLGEYSRVIDALGKKSGFIKIYYDLEDLENETRQSVTIFVTLLLTMLILMTGTLYFILSRFVTRPVSLLREAINELQEGHLGQTVHLLSKDEIGEMGSAFNEMSLRLSESQMAMKAAEEKYRSIFENAIEGIYQTSPEGRYITANPSAAKILGYDSPEELIENVADIGTQIYVRPEDREAFIRLLDENGRVSGFEVQFFRKDGSKIWVAVNGRPVYDEDGKMVLLEGLLQDITERKRAEEELQEYKERLEKLVAERTEELHRRNVELKQEIAERQQIETELEKARDYLKNVFDNSPDAIGIVDSKGEFVMWNVVAAELYGYHYDELKGKSGFDLYADKDELEKMLEKLSQDGFVNRYEITMKRKDGSVAPFEISISLLKDKGGRTIGSVSVARDLTDIRMTLDKLEKTNTQLRQEISERQKIEMELEKARDYLENVFENSPDVIGIVDEHGRFIKWNRMAAKLFGHSFEELKGKKAFDLYDDKDELKKMLEKLRRKNSVNKYEINVKRKDGGVIPVEISISLLKDNQGKNIGSISVTRDLSETKQTLAKLTEAYEKLKQEIIERKRAEENLRESEEKYRNILDSIEEGYFEVDLGGNITLFNDSLCEISSYTRDELIGMNNRQFTTPETSKRMFEAFNEMHRTGKSARIAEYEVIRKDGSTRILELSASLMWNSAGQPIGFRGVSRDTTERKKAEQALRESEQRLAHIINFLPDATFVIDRETRVIAWNLAMETMTGVKAEDILGKGNYEYAIPFYGERRPILVDLVFEPREEFEKKYASVERQGETLIGEAYVPLVYEGVGAYLIGTAGALYDSEGRTVGAIEIIRNITERKQVEEALQRQNDYLAALHETTLGVLNRFDLDDLLTALVSRSGQLFDTPHGFIDLVDSPKGVLESKVGIGIFDRSRVYTQKLGEGLSGRVWQSGEPLAIGDYDAWSGRAPDFGYGLIGAIMAAPLISGQEVVGIIGIAYGSESEAIFGDEDVQLLSRFAQLASIALDNAGLYREAYEAREAAEAANEAKSVFLSTMSHELRTPLNAIIGYSELLMEDAEDLVQENFIPDLERINTSGKHLLGLINDVLDLSKIEAGKVELYLEVFNVASLIEDVASTIRPLVVKNKNTLKVLCEDDIGSMHADMTKVRQSLFNLISNACKFTEQGTITLKVNREPVDENDWITFVVSDTGIGMTEVQMGKIFQAFSQAEASTSGKYGGTGLGLAISKQFCHMMGGDIFVESKTGKGTTFTIRLPAEGLPPRAEPVLPIGPQAEKVLDGAGTVLVVDNDPEVRDLMKRFLTKEGFRVVTASSGEEGLRMAKALHPEVITLDVMMPGMDGWVVLSALKSDSELIDIPVIMLTIVDQKNLGYALGAADYLTKPIDRELLRTVLKKYRKISASLRVLVVEDDPLTREMLRHALEKEGWAVTEAENGRIALKRLAEMRPAIILLDLMMPEMDGFELVAKLRKHEAWRSIPIIVITAKDLTSEDRLRLHGYVEKILQKGAYARKDLLDEVRDLVKVSVRLASAAKE